MKNTLLVILLFSNLISLFYVQRHRPSGNGVRQTDTLWLDTVIRDSFPFPVYTEINRIQTDTLHTVDSVFVPVFVPIEQKEYSTENYRIRIEGYKPNLLDVELFQRFPVITHTDARYIQDCSRWGVGFQVGYGIVGRTFSPYLGIGISYHIWRF